MKNALIEYLPPATIKRLIKFIYAAYKYEVGDDTPLILAVNMIKFGYKVHDTITPDSIVAWFNSRVYSDEKRRQLGTITIRTRK